MKTIIIIMLGSILIAVSSFLVGGAIVATNFQNQINDYHNYYQKTESLLDTIYSHHDIYSIMESDTYFHYEESRDNLINRNYEIANYKNTK